MAEVVALMNSAGQCLVALQKAHVQTCRVGPFPGGAADLFAFVPLAFLAHIADFGAKEFLGLLQLFCGHQFLLEVVWVVDSIAGNISRISLAPTGLLSDFVTGLAGTRVARFFALMEAAWQVSVTGVLAIRNWVRAGLPLSSDKRLDGVVTAGTELQSLGIPRAWSTLSLVALSLALMLSTV